MCVFSSLCRLQLRHHVPPGSKCGEQAAGSTSDGRPLMLFRCTCWGQLRTADQLVPCQHDGASPWLFTAYYR
ncbi:Hypp5507 [Branchiostoma lanceolatum]|uniref:Hypp5507 protein n=1 Tax=Branchiostoma lanceolatum TaxID=7740 RepID=A0A8J9VD98_BRALA|nr:Hypp5507 [Branchiostoma lanceolatum]